MNFSEVPVLIGGVTLLATSASIEEQYSVANSKSLGTQGDGYTGIAASDRQKGSVNISYYLQDGDSFIRGLTGIHLITGSVGPISFTSGLLTSYSLQAEPFSLIEVTAGFEFFNGVGSSNNTGSYSPEDFSLMKGEMSSGVDGVGFNNKLLSYGLNITQGFEPVYVLGEVYPSGYERSNGKISVEIKGTGIADAVDWPCLGLVTTSISLGSTCGDSFEIAFTGMTPESVSYQTSVGDDMVGEVSLVKFF